MSNGDQAQDIGYLLGKMEDVNRSNEALSAALLKHMEDEEREQQKLYRFIYGIYGLFIVSKFIPSDQLAELVVRIFKAV